MASRDLDSFIHFTLKSFIWVILLQHMYAEDNNKKNGALKYPHIMSLKQFNA